MLYHLSYNLLTTESRDGPDKVAQPSNTHPILDSRNLKHAVASYIRDGVYSGTLKAGERIDQDALAEALGVSKIPIREALISLEAEALVISLPRRGSFVAPLAAQDVLDHFQISGLVAGMATSRAATLLTDAQLDQLEATMTRMDTDLDPARLQELNDDFHRLINDVGGSSRIRSILSLLADGVPSRFYEFAVGWSNIANDAHRKILDALKARDGERAGAAMAEHITEGGHRAVRILEELDFWKTDDPDLASDLMRAWKRKNARHW
jgi:DNA-binding GntR family transcriptional regulator